MTAREDLGVCAGTTTYRVEFERVGRRRDVPPATFIVTDADDLAAQIWTYADAFLGSRWFDVLVDLEEMRGSIDAGRFGQFTISEVTS